MEGEMTIAVEEDVGMTEAGTIEMTEIIAVTIIIGTGTTAVTIETGTIVVVEMTGNTVTVAPRHLHVTAVVEAEAVEVEAAAVEVDMEGTHPAGGATPLAAPRAPLVLEGTWTRRMLQGGERPKTKARKHKIWDDGLKKNGLCNAMAFFKARKDSRLLLRKYGFRKYVQNVFFLSMSRRRKLDASAPSLSLFKMFLDSFSLRVWAFKPINV